MKYLPTLNNLIYNKYFNFIVGEYLNYINKLFIIDDNNILHYSQLK